MKILVVYYSRTETTEKVAKYLIDSLKCDFERIHPVNERKGLIGYLKSGKEAWQKTMADIKDTELEPKKYDLVIIGTPIWAWNLSSPVRTYLEKNKSGFKKLAFFCTEGGDGGEKAFLEVHNITGIKPKAKLELKTIDVKKDNHIKETNNFIKEIKK